MLTSSFSPYFQTSSVSTFAAYRSPSHHSTNLGERRRSSKRKNSWVQNLPEASRHWCSNINSSTKSSFDGLRLYFQNNIEIKWLHNIICPFFRTNSNEKKVCVYFPCFFQNPSHSIRKVRWIVTSILFDMYTCWQSLKAVKMVKNRMGRG